MDCLLSCGKIFKGVWKFNIAHFLGGREVKCARIQFQKREAGKFTFERQLFRAVAFLCILLMVDFYSSLLMCFSTACPLHKAACTWCPTLWKTDGGCAYPASHSPQHWWLGKKRETWWVEKDGKSVCQLPSRAKETVIYCQLKFVRNKQTVKHHLPFALLHTFTPDSSASSSGNGGQSVTAVVGSAFLPPTSACVLFMSCSPFG